MALNIRIDFENRYDTKLLDNEFRNSTFESILVDGTKYRLGIRIDSGGNPLMPDVYNLAFGPFDNNFDIDDQAKLRHQDHSRVFSTIVFAAHSFLKAHEGRFLGIDGSNTARAYMYYRCILKNYHYLNSHFNIYGVNYFLRLLRDNSRGYNLEDFHFKTNLILPDENVSGHRLYNYFIFNKK